MFINVDLPAPLWPTKPTHSPTPTTKSTPTNARTAPKLFSTPFKVTMFGTVSVMVNAVNAGIERERRELGS
jgi:hypothetical protein